MDAAGGKSGTPKVCDDEATQVEGVAGLGRRLLKSQFSMRDPSYPQIISNALEGRQRKWGRVGEGEGDQKSLFSFPGSREILPAAPFPWVDSA